MKKLRAQLRQWLGIEALEQRQEKREWFTGVDKTLDFLNNETIALHSAAKEEREITDKWAKELEAHIVDRLEAVERALPPEQEKPGGTARSTDTTARGYVPWSQRRAKREQRSTIVAQIAAKLAAQHKQEPKP